jgi:low temperature requirement protein LtrA
MSTPSIRRPRLGLVLRDGEGVSPLELFFDLVFVLAITQCTALMAHDPTWRGIGRGLVVLALLWWAWVGYAWLTSVVNPDEGAVRLLLFGAMAALLVTSLCIPEAFGDLGLTMVIAYGAVRVAHIVLFVVASRDDAPFRHSVAGLGVSTAVALGILVAGATVHGDARLALWLLALVLDMGATLLIDTNGWRLEPHHFAERHGLIVIVALGESIVAIGVGAEEGVDGGVIAAAILGMAVACALWWAYFDVAAMAAARRLAELGPTQEQSEVARDAYSYLHLPLVASVVLVALGMKATLAHVDDALSWELASALAGGAALFLVGEVAFKWRTIRSFSVQRIVAGAVLVLGIPFAREVDALVTVGAVAAVLWLVLGYEVVRFAQVRDEIRHAHD